MIQYENIQKALGAEIAISQRMGNAIYKWNKMYINEAPWLCNDVKSLNLPAAICQEMARLVTMESKIEINGSARADFVSQTLEKFFAKLPIYVEHACSTGGIVFKPYATPDGKIAVDIARCGNFFPTAFNSAGEATGMIFPEFKRAGRKLYTRLEWHQLDGDTYTVDNRAFVSTKALVRTDDIIRLGQEIPLTEVPEWEALEPHVELHNADRPLFSYFMIPLANNIDVDSPLGVSIYSRAVNQIRDADEQYGASLWEFRSKETAIQASSEFFKRTRNGEVVLPKGKERLYHNLGDNITGKNDEPFFNAFSPDIRDQSFFNGYNKIVQKVEFNSGLAYGTLSDPQVVEKTAEEIKASKQRSYSTVKAIQNSLQDAIDILIGAVDAWCDMESLAPAGAIETSYDWDDSLVVDKKSDIEQLRADVSLGAVGLVEYRMRRFGETEEQAKKMIPDLIDETDVQE